MGRKLIKINVKYWIPGSRIENGGKFCKGVVSGNTEAICTNWGKEGHEENLFI